MNTLGVTLFTIAFIAVCVLFGNYYEKLHVSYSIWLVITIITMVVFIGELLAEKIFKKSAGRVEKD